MHTRERNMADSRSELPRTAYAFGLFSLDGFLGAASHRR
jgi:hypothetical protein